VSDVFWLRLLLIFGAGLIALAGEQGWGWFLFVAAII